MRTRVRGRCCPPVQAGYKYGVKCSAGGNSTARARRERAGSSILGIIIARCQEVCGARHPTVWRVAVAVSCRHGGGSVTKDRRLERTITSTRDASHLCTTTAAWPVPDRHTRAKPSKRYLAVQPAHSKPHADNVETEQQTLSRHTRPTTTGTRLVLPKQRPASRPRLGIALYQNYEPVAEQHKQPFDVIACTPPRCLWG